MKATETRRSRIGDDPGEPLFPGRFARRFDGFGSDEARGASSSQKGSPSIAEIVLTVGQPSETNFQRPETALAKPRLVLPGPLRSYSRDDLSALDLCLQYIGIFAMIVCRQRLYSTCPWRA